MPQLTVTIDLPDEAYRRVLALSPPRRSAFDAALQSAAVASAADISSRTDASAPDLSGIPFFPKRDLPESFGWEAILEIQERIEDEEDAEIIAKSGITRR